ncbi:hypothetical protein CMQ_1369 [Grosmannia clavigera kw1407]|uniref:Rhodopsin domain-containing protein n=1 Tax=Grosmannia clavigera (strain kw1407 / UAMH 11150) TaxID=655863 RepID=F0XF86_GROCL|nr:uncharacterized protein CMQ_1369 [Grosmannia clavigera kw1407]EFX04441.1 hypothetical protein CMQ_1369 [Grosmannia clavigera kw1407]
MSAQAPGLVVGSWTLYGFAIFIVLWRMASRRMLFGSFRKFQLDDYLMMLCVLTFTGVVVSSNKVAVYGSNYADDSEIATWSAQEKANARIGSKLLIVLEECMMTTVWLVKACLLLLYGRLTAGLGESYAVRIVAVYCAVGYVVVQILYFGVWCRPFHAYWEVPVPDDQPQCKTYRHHMITMTAFHVSSDLLMLLIPVPLIARTNLPMQRKVVLCFVFGLGLAVVLVAILNRYYNFTETNSYVFLIWYNGEASTAIMVANIPFSWTLLRKIFSLDAWSVSRKRSQNASAHPTGTTAEDRSTQRHSQYRSLHGLDATESTERITGDKSGHVSLRDLARSGDLSGGKASVRSETTDLERGLEYPGQD